MALSGLIRDKCTYCRKPIEKGKEIRAEVKILGYKGKFNKPFCSKEHLSAYKKHMKCKKRCC